jgi:hypothetical protein
MFLQMQFSPTFCIFSLTFCRDQHFAYLYWHKKYEKYILSHTFRIFSPTKCNWFRQNDIFSPAKCNFSSKKCNLVRQSDVANLYCNFLCCGHFCNNKKTPFSFFFSFFDISSSEFRQTLFFFFFFLLYQYIYIV